MNSYLKRQGEPFSSTQRSALDGIEGKNLSVCGAPGTAPKILLRPDHCGAPIPSIGLRPDYKSVIWLLPVRRSVRLPVQAGGQLLQRVRNRHRIGLRRCDGIKSAQRCGQGGQLRRRMCAQRVQRLGRRDAPARAHDRLQQRQSAGRRGFVSQRHQVAFEASVRPAAAPDRLMTAALASTGPHSR